MPSRSFVDNCASAARWLLLVVLAGHLLFRREFAHLSLGSLIKGAGGEPPAFLHFAFITELALLFIVPVACAVFWRQWRENDSSNGARRLPGVGFFLITGFCGWGALHAVWAIATQNELAPHPITGELQGRSVYLILRQTALSVYPSIFLATVILFRRDERALTHAAFAGLGIAFACALLDTVGLLGPRWYPESKEFLPVYGQETLPLGILGFAYLLFCVKKEWTASWRWTARSAVLLALALVAWRQAARPMQSVVPLGIAGALTLATLLTAVFAIRGTRRPLVRMAACAVFFLLAGTVALGLRGSKTARSGDPQNPGASEVKAWSLGIYQNLYKTYQNTPIPADPKDYMASCRPPVVPVSDPEVYRLQAVFEATVSTSVRNNMWRFLVWQRMAHDCKEHPFTGRGVGRPWFYSSLYQSGFHYGDDREGLDPHNSYLNILFRYGGVGLGLFLAGLGAVLAAAWRGLRVSGGDPLLEAALLYLFYTLIFAFFVVSLEGPSYAMPFWMALGLVAARAEQLWSASCQLADPQTLNSASVSCC